MKILSLVVLFVSLFSQAALAQNTVSHSTCEVKLIGLGDETRSSELVSDLTLRGFAAKVERGMSDAKLGDLVMSSEGHSCRVKRGETLCRATIKLEEVVAVGRWMETKLIWKSLGVLRGSRAYSVQEIALSVVSADDVWGADSAFKCVKN